MPDPKPAARTSDPTEHGGVITGGSKNVLINNLGAARITDYHTCPQVADRVHVGGAIAEASTTVVFNNLHAARVGDKLLCSGPEEGAPPPEEDESNCEWIPNNGRGREAKKIGDTRKDKDYLNIVDSKGVCRVARPVDETVEGALGKGRVTVDVLKAEGKLVVGRSTDNLKDKTTTGVDIGVGGSVLEGKGKYTSPLLGIPFTDLAIGFEGEVTGSLGTLEAKVSLGVIREGSTYKLAASEKLGGLVGQGVKIALVLRTRKPEPPAELPPDKISKGSSNVVIG